MVKSFAGRVRVACLALGESGKEFTATELGDYLCVQTYKEQRRLTGTMRDLKRADLVSGVRPGVYKLTPTACADRGPKLQQAMWRLLRARRTVNLADLEELAGASADYAKEWLRALAKHGVVRRIPAPNNGPHSWRLLVDSVEMPETTDNAEKLRRLRKAKTLAAIGRAEQALAEVREIIAKENEEDE